MFNKCQITFCCFFALLWNTVPGFSGSTTTVAKTASSTASASVVSGAFSVDSLKPPVPWTRLDAGADTGRFCFAVVADRTDGARPGVFEKAVEKLNLLMPEIVLSVGDQIQGYTTVPAEIDKEWKEFDGMVSRLNMPYFRVPGNHDVGTPEELKKWHDRFGDVPYSFVYKNVLFLCLNSIDSSREEYISPSQIAWVKAALAKHAGVRWTFVFLHMPLWEYPSAAGWPGVEEALGTRPFTVFCGHYHAYALLRKKGRDYITLSTTGGGSELRGRMQGEFDHVAWVTMAGREPVVANIMLDGVEDKTVRTVEQRTAIDSFLQEGNCSVRPLYFAEKSQGGATHFFVKNALRFPIIISMKCTDADLPITCTGGTIEKRIAPHTTALFPIQMTVKGAPVVSDRVAGLIHWNAEILSKETMRFSGGDKIAIVKTFVCPPAAAAITVDGVLDDWQELAFDVTKPDQLQKDTASWKGVADSRFRFGACYDSGNVYVGVRVFDDEVVLAKKEFSWDRDGVEFWFDARPDSLRSVCRFDGMIAINPVAAKNEPPVFFPWMKPEGAAAACVATKDGYAAEFSVPLATLNKKNGKSWDGFRLHIAVNDRDKDGQVCLWWRPDPRTDAGYPGSGMFVKEKRREQE